MTEMYIGEIRLYGFNFAPRGWAQCSGQLMSISQNTALFSLLGTMYGGDGVQTFALPDLRGRVAVNQGTGPGLATVYQGDSGGQTAMSLTTNNLPTHVHGVQPPVAGSSTSKNPAGNVPGLTTSSAYNPTASGAGAAFNSGPAGGSQPFDIRNPYLGLNYCIALEGIFPSRN